MKKIFLLFVFVAVSGFSQSVNDYEYVIVPSKFTDFKEKGKYNLNNYTKLLLQKYGFKAFLDTDSVPDEVANANCKKLYADVVKGDAIMLTKIKVLLKDCRSKVLYETDYGTSREKDLPMAYNLALREAGKSFETLNYKYNGKIGI